jgi:adenylate cyclase
VEGQPSAGAWLVSTAGARTAVLGTCSLGRAATCSVVLNDERVSRRHAMINAQEAGEFWLIDLGSSNGTYLNGRRVVQPCRLQDGDRVEVASFAFTFQQTAAPLTQRPPDTATDRTLTHLKSFQSWLLVADIEDSTQLIRRLKPEEASRLTGNWLLRCKEIIEAHQGAINKFLGDGFIAYWPERENLLPHIVGSLATLQRLQEQGQPPFRFALHYGKVMSGGGATLGEENLLGSEVNFVFRMEKLAPALNLSRLLSETAGEALREHLALRDAGRHPIAGFDGEFHFFTL